MKNIKQGDIYVYETDVYFFIGIINSYSNLIDFDTKNSFGYKTSLKYKNNNIIYKFIHSISYFHKNNILTISKFNLPFEIDLQHLNKFGRKATEQEIYKYKKRIEHNKFLTEDEILEIIEQEQENKDLLQFINENDILNN